MRSVNIVSTGAYVPEIEVPNDVFRERLRDVAPEFVDKIEGKSGITTRYYAPDDWATSDVIVPAAEQALRRAGLSAGDLDLIIVGTDSPDYITPSTSVVVQHKLGAPQAGTFDVGCACASFPTAVSVAAGLMATQTHFNNVLVVGAYMMHKLCDPADRMAFFYGDGAGAAIMQPTDEPGVLTSTFLADGSYAKAWGIYAGGTAEPVTHAAIEEGRHQVRLVDVYPPSVNEVGWVKMVHSLCTQGEFTPNEIDHYVFTQVRRRTIHKVMDKLEQPHEKAHMIMHKWGYTGSACLPMALHDLIESGNAEPGDLVALVGSGVGYNQAAVALRLDPQVFSAAA